MTNNPTPSVIKMMGKCLDLDDILEMEESEELKQEREKNLKMVMRRAKYAEDEQKQIVAEYEVFKDRVRDLNTVGGENEEIVSRFEHLLFKIHTCNSKCVKVVRRAPGKHDAMICNEKGKLVQPRKPELMKFIHLICKEPTLYTAIQNFLHLLIRWAFFGGVQNIISIYHQMFGEDPRRRRSGVYGQHCRNACG